MNTVAVVDYGMGNLRSVSQAVQHAAAGQRAARWSSPRDPEEVRAADARGAAGAGRHARLHARAARSGLQESVLEAAASKPLFGVCVGMQMLLRPQRGRARPTAWA